MLLPMHHGAKLFGNMPRLPRRNTSELPLSRQVPLPRQWTAVAASRNCETSTLVSMRRWRSSVWCIACNSQGMLRMTLQLKLTRMTTAPNYVEVANV